MGAPPNAGIRETDVAIVVRQFMLTCPPRDLSRFTIRPAVAVLLPSIALVKKLLILALQRVVEHDSANPSALAAQALVGPLVGAVDLGVVSQLAWLPDAGVEALARLPAAVVAFVAVETVKTNAVTEVEDPWLHSQATC